MSRKMIFGAATVFLVGLSGAALFLRADDARVPATIGAKETAKWSATTLEAASTPEHKKVLDNAKQATIVGEIVDVTCYLQLGKRGEKHIACGQKCVRSGQPGGILDDEGNLVLLIAEQHHPRRDGEVSLAEKVASMMGQRVAATGMLTETRGSRGLFVEAPAVVPASPAPPASAAPAAPAK